MGKSLTARHGERRAKARREFALTRPEMLQPSTPRVAAVGPVSMAVKARDPSEERLIEAYLAQQKNGGKNA